MIDDLDKDVEDLLWELHLSPNGHLLTNQLLIRRMRTTGSKDKRAVDSFYKFKQDFENNAIAKHGTIYCMKRGNMVFYSQYDSDELRNLISCLEIIEK